MNMNIDHTDKIGEIVRTERKRLHVTQKELAMTSGTGLRFVKDIERGKPTSQTGKVLQVLNTLGLKIQIGH